MSFFKWLEDIFKSAQTTATNTSKPEIPEIAPTIEISKVEPVKEVPKLVPDAKKIVSESSTDKINNIAIIVGHTSKSQGAVNYKNETEFTFNSRIANKIKTLMEKKYPNKKVKIFFRQDGYYSTAVAAVGSEVGKFKAKISLELHFNSHKKDAYGCEILIWEGAKSFQKTLKLADQITDRMATKFGLKERDRHKNADGTSGDGVKVLASKERGALNIKSCNDNGVVHAMLIEPCFANMKTEESKAIFENEDKYAEFLADELAKIDV